MYLNDGWTFMVELAGEPPLAVSGAVMLDLSMPCDRGLVSVRRDGDGVIRVFVGVDGEDPEKEGAAPVEAVHFWRYDEASPFRASLPAFRPVGEVGFARAFLDALAFDGLDEEEIGAEKARLGL